MTIIKKEQVQNFIFGLLGKRNRRLYILRHLKSTNSGHKRSPQERIQTFVQKILYEPVYLQITNTCLSVWRNEFSIPFTWMTEEERMFVVKMHACRKHLFKSIAENESSVYLKDFVYNHQLWAIEWRREFLRDYIFDVLSSTKEKLAIQTLFIQITQQLILNPSNEEKIDPFLMDVHHVLQCNGSIVKLCTKTI